MKTLLIALAAVLLAAPAAEAGTRRSYSPAGYCAPVLTHTCLVNRRCEWRTAHDACGYCYQYRVMIITTRGYYSDGSTRTWTNTQRA